MSSLSKYLRDALLEHVFRGVTYKPADTLYVGLFLADPANGSEVSAASYERRPIAFGEPSLLGVISSFEEIVFTEAREIWGLVTDFALFDAKTGGRLLVSGKLDEPRYVAAGDIFRFKAGGLSVSFREFVEVEE